MYRRFQQNPFALLGVTPRDNRRRIVELAEERSLELDHDACQKARSDLTNPRTRLSAEIEWLPGISPKKALQLVSVLLEDPMAIRAESGLPTLAKLNLLAAVSVSVDSDDSVDDIYIFIREFADLFDELSADQVLRDINEDRLVSGFPEVKGIDQIEAELSGRKRYYVSVIMDILKRFPTASLVEVMTAVVDDSTCSGEEHAPELIDDLVESYAVHTHEFLGKEAQNAQKLINAARGLGESGGSAVTPIVEKLEAVVRNWDKVAQPIQLSAKARGINHELSREIAYSVRNLAIDLYNEHGMLACSQRLTSLVQELFAELPEVHEQMEQDAEALANILENRNRTEAQKIEWAREITYRAEVGLIFKEILSISPDGIAWNNRRFPLDAITRVRWGGVRNSVNGIPTGTNYTIAFGDASSEAVVSLRNESTYSTFIDKLWRAIAVRLLTELLETLRAGKEVSLGDALLRDDGITLVRHKFWNNELVRCAWNEVHVWSADGTFYVGAQNDKKTYVGFSYINTPNTHVLEQAIRTSFKKGGRRLSDILN